eukprot:Gb_08113 [translate_table: standard]
MAMASPSVMCGRNGGDCSHGVCSMVASRHLQFQRVVELVQIDMERFSGLNNPALHLTKRSSSMQIQSAAAKEDDVLVQNQLALNGLSHQIAQMQTQLALQNKQMQSLFQREQLLEFLASSAQFSNRNSAAICNTEELIPPKSGNEHVQRDDNVRNGDAGVQPRIPNVPTDLRAMQSMKPTIRWLSGGNSKAQADSSVAKTKDIAKTPSRQQIRRQNRSCLSTPIKRVEKRNSVPAKNIADKGSFRVLGSANGQKVLCQNGSRMRKGCEEVQQCLTAKDLAKLFLLQRNEFEKSVPCQGHLKSGNGIERKEEQNLNTEELAKLLVQRTSELDKFEHELKNRWLSPEAQAQEAETAFSDIVSPDKAEECYDQPAELCFESDDSKSNLPDENMRLTDAILEDVLEDVCQEVASFCDEYVEHLYLCEFMAGPQVRHWFPSY